MATRNQTASSSSKTEQDSEVFNKYNNKRTRIDDTLYKIKCGFDYDGKIEVRMVPLGPDADTASSNISYDSYAYTGGHPTYQRAVTKAKNLASKIEASLIADFNEEEL